MKAKEKQWRKRKIFQHNNERPSQKKKFKSVKE